MMLSLGMLQEVLRYVALGPRGMPSEVLVNLALTATFILGCRQYLEVYCKGEQHPIPANSRILSNFPCGSGAAREVAYLFSKAHVVMWDLLHVHPDEYWVSMAAVGLLLRLASSALLPARAYTAVVLPVSCYFLRAVVPAFVLAKGPGFQPSPLTLRAIFRNHAMFDLVMFCTLLGVWRVRPAVELVFSCCSAAAVWLLAYWHSHLVPGGVNWPLQIAAWSLMPIAKLIMERAVRMRTMGAIPTQPGGHGDSPTAGTAAGRAGLLGGKWGLQDGDGDGGSCCGSGAGEDPCIGTFSDGDPAGQHPRHHRNPKAEQRGEGGVLLLRGGRAQPEPDRLAASSPQPAAVEPDVFNAGPGAAVDEAAAVYSDALPTAARSANSLSAGASAAPQGVPTTDAPPASGPRPAPGAASDAPHQPVSPLPPYSPFFQHHVYYFKIPWGEPEQLPGDFRERLRQLVEREDEGEGQDGARGGGRDQDREQEGPLLGLGRGRGPARRRRLAHVHVRRGCVELTVVVEEYAAGPRSPATPPGPAHPPSSSGPWLGMDEVLRALGLEPPPLPPPHPGDQTEGSSGPREGTSAGAAPGSFGAAPPAPLTVQTWWVDSGDAASEGEEETQQRGRAVEVAFDDAGSRRSAEQYVVARPGPDVKDLTRHAALGRVWPRPGRPRVLSAWPRVALLPPQPSHQQKQHGTGAALPLPPSCFPLTLRVVVDWGQTHTAAAAATTTATTASNEYVTSTASQGARNPQVPHLPRVSADPPCGSSAPVAPVHWRYSEPVRVLVRAGNSFLPARIAAYLDAAPDASNPVPTWRKYDVEVLQAPAAVGTLEVELSSGSPAGGPSASPPAVVVIPLLVTDDAGSAGEISDLAARWPDDIRWQLDGLLYDAGSWMAAEATRLQDPAPATWAPSALPRSRLGAHLREFFASADCPASLELLNRGGSYMAAEGHEGEASRALEGQGATSAAQSITDVTTKGSEKCVNSARTSGDGGSEEAAGASWQWLRGDLGAVGQRGSSRGPLPWSPAEQWSAAMAGTISLMECGLFLSLALRAYLEGAHLLSPQNLTTAVRASIPAALALARMALPYRNWARLAVRARLLRYGASLASKLLVVTGRAPLPPGSSSYVPGVGMLLHEGLILPGCCLLEPRTAVLVAAVKLLLNARILAIMGASTAPAAALLMAGRVEALALGTTAACHWYLSTRHRRHQQAGRWG